MKLFLKEHLSLIIVQSIQFIFIIGLFALDGYINISLAIYSLFISSFILLCYLIYRYINNRSFYRRLSHPLDMLGDSLKRLDKSQLSMSLYVLLKSQYEQYKRDLLQAEQKQEQHLIFIDRWVHQMKTPLSVLQLMAKDLDEPESSNIREELDRMQTGLQMVLNMARLRTIERDFNIKKVTLNKVIQDVIQENRRLFIKSKIFPQVSSEENMIVQSDEKWLFFVLSQLIENAVKYSANKSKTIDISIGKRNRHLIVTIQDYGIGIPKEDMKRIFDPFYTGENGRKFRESTGVGLFLVREVISYLGHQIEVESDVNIGTTFRIVFI